jgi:four helix bundle protein
MKNFKELRVWQKSFELSIACYRFTRFFPDTERYNLISQINSAAISIPSNIAEGGSRNSEKEYRRFLEIVLGSAYELETQLLIADALNYGDLSNRQSIIYNVKEVQKILIGFIKTLSKTNL